ncbi:MerR family transcriptional regulator [Timonella sp. A28]|uniref:MerR family transcriptional regulator n=1 Tax=Timonella sp. A28 TaxID=3442640 RepID=UPI003EC1018E
MMSYTGTHTNNPAAPPRNSELETVHNTSQQDMSENTGTPSPLFDEPTYSVATAAARVGVAPATLRTWARRHQLGPTDHASGKHRRYTNDDLIKLMVMRTAMLAGATSSEAAHQAHTAHNRDVTFEQAERELRETKAATADKNSPHTADSRTRHTATESSEEDTVPAEKRTLNAPTRVHVGRAGHLTIAPLESEYIDPTDYAHRCTELVASALRSEHTTCQELLEITPEEDIVEWWEKLVQPALDRLAGHTVLAQPGQNPRTLICYLAQTAISQFMQTVRPQNGQMRRPHPSQLKNIALVFAPPVEDLSLPAHVLAAALAAQDCTAHVILGPENERRVTELVRMVRPTAAVFVTTHAGPDTAVINAVNSLFPELPILVGIGREGGDLGDLMSQEKISGIRSFKALFHEVHATVCSQKNELNYWPEDTGVISLNQP